MSDSTNKALDDHISHFLVKTQKWNVKVASLLANAANSGDFPRCFAGAEEDRIHVEVHVLNLSTWWSLLCSVDDVTGFEMCASKAAYQIFRHI